MSTARSNPTGEQLLHAVARGAPPFGVRPLPLGLNSIFFEAKGKYEAKTGEVPPVRFRRRRAETDIRCFQGQTLAFGRHSLYDYS